MKSNDIEILSPAGNLEALICAVDNGADAVYIGGKKFGARKNAVNFTIEEIKQGVEYAHLSGAKVYVTVNTLIFDEEINDVIDFINELYALNVDAIIVQDLAVLDIIKKYFPDMKAHASTQMTLCSLSGVDKAYAMGFSRVVLSRELSMEEIEHITKNAKAETEVFVHGALCVCYSGQCLMSSVIGSRSGNRGECAQPCRLPYKFGDYSGLVSPNSRYLLSMKDLCLVNQMDFFNKSGVKSLKIEGRMKNKEYVSIITDLYSKVKNGYNVSYDDYRQAQQIFSRNGFTTLYFDGKKGREMLNYHSNNDDVYKNIPKILTEKAQSMGNRKKRKTDAYICAKKGEHLTLTLVDEFSNSATYTLSTIVETAKNSCITYEKIKQSISKMGDTFFYLDNLYADFDIDAYISAKDLNLLRRECARLLKDNILMHKRCKKEITYFEYPKKSIPKEFKYRAKVNSVGQFKICIESKLFEYIFVPYELFSLNREFFIKYADNIVVSLPAVLRDRYLLDLDISDVKNVSVSNIGQLSVCEGKNIFGDEGLNVTNSVSCGKYYNMGIKSIMLSLEMTLLQTAHIQTKAEKEIFAYGRMSLMTTENCIMKAHFEKCVCKSGKFFSVTDRKNKVFPVICNKFNCTNTIYNSLPVFMADKTDKIKESGVDAVRLVFTDEDAETVKKVIDAYKNNSKPDMDFTRGHFFRGVVKEV